MLIFLIYLYIITLFVSYHKKFLLFTVYIHKSFYKITIIVVLLRCFGNLIHLIEKENKKTN